MNIDTLLLLLGHDYSLSQTEKEQITEILQDQQSRQRFLSSIAGSALGVAIAKYAKLSTKAQVLLGAAGFGIGRLIYNYLKQDNQQFAKYNGNIRTYEMDTTRY